MKAIIKFRSLSVRLQRWLWFFLLWGAEVLAVAGLAYGLRVLVDPLLGA